MDTDPTIYVYGFREPPVVRISPTTVASFIMGANIPLDAELAEGLRAEFNAQERYRLKLLQSVQKVCGQLLQEAVRHVAFIEQPCTDPVTAFWHGYALGKYEAYSTAAAALSETPILAAMEIESDVPDAEANSMG